MFRSMAQPDSRPSSTGSWRRSRRAPRSRVAAANNPLLEAARSVRAKRELRSELSPSLALPTALNVSDRRSIGKNVLHDRARGALGVVGREGVDCGACYDAMTQSVVSRATTTHDYDIPTFHRLVRRRPCRRSVCRFAAACRTCTSHAGFRTLRFPPAYLPHLYFSNRNGAVRRTAVSSSAAQPTSSNRQKCSAGISFAAARADLKTDICPAGWSSVGIGTTSHPSPGGPRDSGRYR
jgi:hypothetical protein